jgi:hypothetical protein
VVPSLAGVAADGAIKFETVSKYAEQVREAVERNLVRTDKARD